MLRYPSKFSVKYLMPILLFSTGFLLGCHTAQEQTAQILPKFLDTTVVNAGQSIRVEANVISDSIALLTFIRNKRTYLIDSVDGIRALLYIKMIDFDKNGSADILMDYRGNNSLYVLYLFDSTRHTFRNIDNYMSFPDAEQLEHNPDLYYSYHRAGCADYNWVSDLFAIHDFTIVHLGTIDGHGCDADKEQYIEVSRIISGEEVLLEKLPYVSEGDSKFDFINRYWNQNFQRFK